MKTTKKFLQREGQHELGGKYHIVAFYGESSSSDIQTQRQ